MNSSRSDVKFSLESLDWLKSNNFLDSRLPALDFLSNEMLFYLGYALPWCASNSASEALKILKVKLEIVSMFISVIIWSLFSLRTNMRLTGIA